MWTTENRIRYDRDHLRYPSDLTNAEWALIERFIPPAKHGGRKREVDEREIINGLMYVLSTGCEWRAVPTDVPARSTLHDYFSRWHWDGTLDRIHHALYMQCRERAGREASPTAAIIDSQCVKGAEKGARSIDPSRYHAGKKIKGRKRCILADTQGLLMQAIIHAAKVQDRDGGIVLMTGLFGLYPFSLKLFADGGHQRAEFQRGLRKVLAGVEVDIVKRSDQANGFTVLPKRWIVECTFAWLNRCRRLAKDWENLKQNAPAFLRLASIRMMMRKPCNPA